MRLLLLRAVPDLVRLLARLLLDPLLPRRLKLLLVAAAVYLASPLDVVPDVVPFLGYLDDVLLGAVLVDGVLNHVDRALLLKYWPGTPQSLQRVAWAARVLSAWVPRGLKRRAFGAR